VEVPCGTVELFMRARCNITDQARVCVTNVPERI